MSEATHTPGPWRAVECSHEKFFRAWDVETVDDYAVRVKKNGQPHKNTPYKPLEITSSFFMFQKIGAIRWEGDARLIAAAPELLDACRKALAVLTSEATCDATGIFDLDAPGGLAISAIASAIRKAVKS